MKRKLSKELTAELSTKEFVILNLIMKDSRLCGMIYSFILGYQGLK